MFTPGVIFLSIGFPFVDLRSFLEVPTFRLRSPSFPLADPEAKEFIRSSGRIEARKQGGIDEWAGEEVFGRAATALKFPNHLRLRSDFSGVPQPIKANEGAKRPESNLWLERSLTSIFDAEDSEEQSIFLPSFAATYSYRRFYSNGIVSRLEVGLRLNSTKGQNFSLQPLDCLNILSNTLRFKVRVPSAHPRNFTLCSLAEAGQPLAEHYLRATTERVDGKLPYLEKWWFKAGSPVVVFHYRPTSLLSDLPPHSKRVPPLSAKQDFSLAYLPVTPEKKKASIRTWLLGSDRHSEIDRLRQLRIHLLRLHMEREGVKEVLRRIRTKDLVLAEGPIQDYLETSISLLNRRKRFGLDQAALLDSAKYLADLISPGERATLLSELGQASKTVTRKIERITRESTERAAVTLILNNSPHATVDVGGIDMSKSITFGDNTTVEGNFTVTVADTIERSFNTAVGSKAPDELKEELKKLAEQVAEMAKLLPSPKAEDVARKLEDLTKEATSDQPRKEWYEFSGEGLIEAAKAVGEIAAPVITTVKAILTLLA